MKKLIMFMGAIMAAVSVHAASCQWSGMAVPLPTGSTATDLSIYLIDSTTTSLADMTTALDGGSTAKLSSNVSTTTGIAAGTTAARWNSTFGTYTAGDSFTYYTVILNKDSTQYMITPEITGKVPTSGNLMMSFSTQAGNSWNPVGTPIPEPTSALLLILGMAGLALKRKRA